MKFKIQETRPREPRHFAMIPRMVNETKMSTQSYRLYGHIKQVAGDNGHCWQTIKNLAKVCSMSKSSIIKAREELEALGFITVSKVVDERKGIFYVMSPTWLWDENNNKYDRNQYEAKQKTNTEDYSI